MNEYLRTEKKELKLTDGTVLDPFVIRLLRKRGVVGGEAIRTFLEPRLSELPNPFLMKGMERAVLLLEKALMEKKTILIWGDYDVDGTTSTALLLKFFRQLGLQADFYIPNRLTEGYGLQEKALSRVSRTLLPANHILVTVDNGISAHGAVNLAKELGYTTIITDHHTPPSEDVPADAILNPQQKDCSFPAKNLAGVGVAIYLAMGLRSHLLKTGYFQSPQNIPNLKSLLDLVTVGTIADMVPLHGVNRILVRAGMETISTKSNKGLTALFRASDLDVSFVRAEDISFQIAPKINAAGRLGTANKAVELFLVENNSKATSLARELCSINKCRKDINIEQLANAKRYLKKQDIAEQYSVVVDGEYHIGVAGIVAANLVEMLNTPCVILCRMEGGLYKGSARSVPGVDLYKALKSCQNILCGYGGHKMAAGLSVHSDNIQRFKEMFDKAVYAQNKGQPTKIKEQVDSDIEVGVLFDKGIWNQLHLLEPFGLGNPQPVFRDTKSELVEVRPVGKEKDHLRLAFNWRGRVTIKGIAFGMGNLAGRCRNNMKTEITYTPSLNFFRGKRNWQVRVTKITFCDQ